MKENEVSFKNLSLENNDSTVIRPQSGTLKKATIPYHKLPLNPLICYDSVKGVIHKSKAQYDQMYIAIETEETKTRKYLLEFDLPPEDQKVLRDTIKKFDVLNVLLARVNQYIVTLENSYTDQMRKVYTYINLIHADLELERDEHELLILDEFDKHAVRMENLLKSLSKMPTLTEESGDDLKDAFEKGSQNNKIDGNTNNHSRSKSVGDPIVLTRPTSSTDDSIVTKRSLSSRPDNVGVIIPEDSDSRSTSPTNVDPTSSVSTPTADLPSDQKEHVFNEAGHHLVSPSDVGSEFMVSTLSDSHPTHSHHSSRTSSPRLSSTQSTQSKSRRRKVSSTETTYLFQLPSVSDRISEYSPYPVLHTPEPVLIGGETFYLFDDKKCRIPYPLLDPNHIYLNNLVALRYSAVLKKAIHSTNLHLKEEKLAFEADIDHFMKDVSFEIDNLLKYIKSVNYTVYSIAVKNGHIQPEDGDGEGNNDHDAIDHKLTPSNDENEHISHSSHDEFSSSKELSVDEHVPVV